MLANNETGVLQPVTQVARLARSHGSLVHTDAAQAVGKIPIDVVQLGVDLLTVAGHKLYAPKGVGALYVRRGAPLRALVEGGGQEGGRRAGTEAVHQIVALGAAARVAQRRLASESVRQQDLRDRLHRALRDAIPAVTVTGDASARLPNTLHVRFPGLVGRALLAALPDVAASAGAACHAGEETPSGVLLAMGIAPDDALGAVRFSIGRATTSDDVDRAARSIALAHARVTRGADSGPRLR
jgi:cysteine desulfurase